MGILLYFASNALVLPSILAALAFVSFATFCVRRIYFHPLSKYPGPLLAKITDLYAAYHAWKGDIHFDMHKCHEIYGPYVRYAPNRININQAPALKDIYVGNKNFQKSPNYRVLRHQAANSLTMINKTEHARRRRIISQGLSDASIKLQEDVILAHIKKCFSWVTETETVALSSTDHEKRQDEWSQPNNMGDWFTWLTFDIMGDVVFGMQHNLLGSSANHAIPEAIEQSNIRVSVLLQSPSILRIGRMDRWLFPKAIEARDQFLQFVNGIVNHCMKPKAEVASRTVLSILQSSTDPITGEKLTPKEILAESTTLCVAGADTSSTALAAVFHYLTHNPHAYKAAEQEVRSAFRHESEIRIGSALNSLVYVKACIDEALRMSPPAGSSLFRQVQSGGALVNGHHFPEGVDVGVPIYGIHHNADYFPSPFEYKPERWIVRDGGVTKDDVEVARAAFCPFSVGTRSCVGKGMALVELNLAVAYALFTFDIKLADEQKNLPIRSWAHPGEFALDDHITGSKNGPIIRFRRVVPN